MSGQPAPMRPDTTKTDPGEALPPTDAPCPDERCETGADRPPGRPREIGGRDGPDPTRYGDWEKDGRCIDF